MTTRRNLFVHCSPDLLPSKEYIPKRKKLIKTQCNSFKLENFQTRRIVFMFAQVVNATGVRSNRRFESRVFVQTNARNTSSEPDGLNIVVQSTSHRTVFAF